MRSGRRTSIEHVGLTSNARCGLARGRSGASGRCGPQPELGTEIAKRAKLLLADKDLLARALTIKLLTYATGARPTDADGPQIDALVAKVRKKDYGFRSPIHEIVAGKLFRSK